MRIPNEIRFFPSPRISVELKFNLGLCSGARLSFGLGGQDSYLVGWFCGGKINQTLNNFENTNIDLRSIHFFDRTIFTCQITPPKSRAVLP